MLVEVWSDIMCPWCYIGKRRLEKALARLGDPRIGITWRSYELRPGHTRTPDITLGEGMVRWRGRTEAEVTKLFGWIRSLGAQEGLALNLDTVRPVSSFDAHRLTHLAGAYGLRDEMTERLFRAHLTENVNVADHEVLLDLADEVGLDAATARQVLDSDRYAAEVHAEARAEGVTAVPTVLVDRRQHVAGAAEVTEYLALLHRAQAAAAPS
ncbi:DsbA family oxidoreductase [Micromonospora marina]|uniref:Predicted dithiol-disulfide isomerase, DsbA family n=1 Tax=Micromonospora marina TaxID=307120 RepID=A0A1C4ZW70_9ACTN|nr:DsbA family oxidoreductase [Micromonospora marina]SCF37210.1 Predicted dithiol-disulfide isomerase, DsbA family [Micromonospora marina]